MAHQPLEDREYEVHPSQLRWAMSNPAQPVEDAANAVGEAVTLAVRAVLVLAALAGLWLLRYRAQGDDRAGLRR